MPARALVMTERATQRLRRVANVRELPSGVVKLQLLLPNARTPKTFQRPADEPLAKTRQRIELAAANAMATGDSKSDSRRQRSKKRGKAQDGGNSPPTEAKPAAVRFFGDDGQEIVFEDSATVGAALFQSAHLTIGDAVEYVLVRNSPAVESIWVLGPLLVGIPVVPFAETLHCDGDGCEWRWFRLPETSGSTEELVATTRSYTPIARDVGARFRLECAPPSRGASEDTEIESSTQLASIVTPPAEEGPDRSVFSTRQELGKSRADENEIDAFRVMSYNVLFDGYTTDHAKRSKFAYANPRAIKEPYRMQLVAQEVLESNSDLVLMQEMGGAVFSRYFDPLMRAKGFTPLYAGKTGSTVEGCAMLIRSSCFGVLEHFTVDVSAAVASSTNPAVQAVLEHYGEVKKGVMTSPTIAQIAVLQHVQDSTKRLVVSNTHLFFRYDADLIRLLQTAALVELVDVKRNELASANPSKPPPAIVMGGDWNAFPNASAIEFLLDGVVPNSHRHIQSATTFQWDGVPTIEALREAGGSTIFSAGEADNSNLKVELPKEFAHKLKFESGCGIPEFTNYASSPGHLFAATLDYVVLEVNRLQVKQVFPNFTRDEVSSEVALPSTTFPSDHVSIVCDLGWRY